MQIKLFGKIIKIEYSQTCTKYIDNGFLKIKLFKKAERQVKQDVVNHIPNHKNNREAAIKSCIMFAKCWYNNIYYYDKDYVKDLTISLKDAIALVKKWGYR